MEHLHFHVWIIETKGCKKWPLWSLLCWVSAQQLPTPLLSYSCLQLLWPCTDFCQVSCSFLVYRNMSACLIDKNLFFRRSPGTPPLSIFFFKIQTILDKINETPCLTPLPPSQCWEKVCTCTVNINSQHWLGGKGVRRGVSLYFVQDCLRKAKMKHAGKWPERVRM